MRHDLPTALMKTNSHQEKIYFDISLEVKLKLLVLVIMSLIFSNFTKYISKPNET